MSMERFAHLHSPRPVESSAFVVFSAGQIDVDIVHGVPYRVSGNMIVIPLIEGIHDGRSFFRQARGIKRIDEVGLGPTAQRRNVVPGKFFGVLVIFGEVLLERATNNTRLNVLQSQSGPIHRVVGVFEWSLGGADPIRESLARMAWLVLLLSVALLLLRIARRRLIR